MTTPSPVSASVLDEIGNTPMHEITKLDTGKCRLFVKLENQNPGGSIKDRIGKAMIEAAEADGSLKPGVNRHLRRHASIDLLAYAPEYQHVGVHRHTYRQYDTRDTRQRQRGAYQRHHGDQQHEVDGQGDYRHQAEQAVNEQHEQHSKCIQNCANCTVFFMK